MRRKNVIIIVSVLVIIMGGIFAYSRYNTKHPFKSKKGTIEFRVTKADTLNSIVDKLANQGLINYPDNVRESIKKGNYSSKVVPGLYSISTKISLSDFIKKLNNGTVDKNRIVVTIPEGYDINQIATLLDSKGIINKQAFLESCKNYKNSQYVKTSKYRDYPVEGYLFPDTYEFNKKVSGENIIDTMVNRFDSVLDSIQDEIGIDVQNEKMDSIIIMASIVEREVNTSQERSKAASVFYNRLKKNMKLQSCATVLYSLGIHKDKLSIKDTKVKSPYNTYRVKGLPPGPICNPGKDAIEAAIKPDKTNYLYFVLTKSGTHFFTNSYKEFLKVKQKQE